MTHYLEGTEDPQAPAARGRASRPPRAVEPGETPPPQAGARVEAIDRALELLVALADAGPAGATLADLAARADVNKSTAHRALVTLRGRGFATQDGGGATYRLGPTAYELGDRAHAPANLARALHPALVALSRATQELVHLGVLAGDHVRYVDKVEPDRAIRVWSAVGQEVPIATTAMGRALLAARGVPDGMLSGYLRNLPAGRETAVERLRESVAFARARGYAVEVEENEQGVACIGAAILRSGSPVAAFSITALAVRMTEQRQEELADLIVREVVARLPEGLTLPAALIEGPVAAAGD